MLDPAWDIMIRHQKSGNISGEWTGKSVSGEDGETSVHSTAVALMNLLPKSDTSFMGEEGHRGTVAVNARRRATLFSSVAAALLALPDGITSHPHSGSEPCTQEDKNRGGSLNRRYQRKKGGRGWG